MLTKSPSRLNIVLAVLMIVIPVAFVTAYMYIFAQDRYVSESVVVVKQIGEASVSPISGLGVLLGKNNTSVEDAQFLKEYIGSADLVAKLDQKFNFRRAFQGDGNDPIFQIGKDATQEELIKYYQSRVTISLDETTSLLSVTTEGFEPKFAYAFNQEVLAESEKFINDISQKVATEQLVYAEGQLSDASKRLAMAKEKLIDYQNNNKTYDPSINAAAVNSLIASLKASLAELQTQERTLLSYLNPDTPQVIAVRSQISSLQSQIDQEQNKLTSNSGDKLNRQAVQFETLKSDVEFSVDLYKLSLTALETARLEAVRKMKSLVVISSAKPAQDSMYPRRGYVIFSTFLVCGLLYGLVRLMLSVIRDHRD